MTALLRAPAYQITTDVDLSSEMRALLDKFRDHNKICRASPRLSIFDACAVLDPDSTRAEVAQIRTLLRVLGQALSKDPVLYQTGTRPLSFDERWLVAVLSARMRGDMDSFTFLIHRRIEHSKRRIFGLLVSGLADILTETR